VRSGARSAIELLAALAGEPGDGRRQIATTHPEVGMEAALAAGVIAGSAAPTVDAQLRPDRVAAALSQLVPAQRGVLEVDFRPSPTLGDGRFANHAWLLEQPDPVTKLTWDNAILIAPESARRLALDTEDMVELALEGRAVRGPILVVPGHAADAVTLWLGYGRRDGAPLAAGVGFDAYLLRTAARPGFAFGGALRAVGARHPLARTQHHFDMQGRAIALTTTRALLASGGGLSPPPPKAEELPSLMPPSPAHGVGWAMSIDLAICTGCSACMVACQAENNIPVVGKENVLNRREMHWLRVDTYFHGPIEAPRAVHQPMMCQHCETAPCEYVCPVNATVHSSDGLNEMVYNRCVGTRFCSNNCPYKVRRFNWFNWKKRYPALDGAGAELQRNPEVTVRDRGVMEKCSYCVQRIRTAEIAARGELRPLRPGEVVTACQQACPTGAIQFGLLAHTQSEMVKWRSDPRAYGVLEEQGTRPRTRYLARVDHRHPELG
jgi:molybdopterin-containing oxidoreductase family iron-sulfur binding subunit